MHNIGEYCRQISDTSIFKTNDGKSVFKPFIFILRAQKGIIKVAFEPNLYFSITLEIDIQLNVANLYAVMREEKDMKLNSLRNWNINCEY